MTTTEKPSVLVLLATGMMGSGVVDAFLASEKYKVFGTSRNPRHQGLLAKGVTPVPFSFGNAASIRKALQVSKADVVVIITDLIKIAKSRENEVMHGKVIVDACKEAGTPHVIFCSSDSSETAPEEANHMRSKWEIEQYIKTVGLSCYSILQASSFFENFDDPGVMNPLQRGYLKDLYDENVRVPHIATLDIGKAALVMADNPDKWRSKSLKCVVSCDTGDECAKVLSDVSGVPCVYRVAPPRFILRLFVNDLYHMVKHVSARSAVDRSDDIRQFKAVVPDAMGVREWFVRKGQWADGSKFNEPPPPRKLYVGQLAFLGVVLAVGAYAYGVRRTQ